VCLGAAALDMARSAVWPLVFLFDLYASVLRGAAEEPPAAAAAPLARQFIRPVLSTASVTAYETVWADWKSSPRLSERTGD
jgi:hypothetical protein